MNDRLHPTMAQAIAGFIPSGFRSAPVLDAVEHWQSINQDLRRHLAQYDAPPCPRGCFAYTYRHPELGDLECHFEGEDADESVGWPEQVTLCAAYLRGVDITDRLSFDEIKAIEMKAKPDDYMEAA